MLTGNILTTDGWIHGTLEYENGRITALTGERVDPSKNDAPYILPGFIDLHVHGGGGSDVMEGGDAIETITRTHAGYGTTSLLATTMTAPRDELMSVVAELGNNAPVKSTDIYFSVSGSLQEGNPQLILDRHETVKLPPVLLLQGSADVNGVVKDTNVSPEIQRRFANSYGAAGGKIHLELLPGAPHNFVNTDGPYLDRALALMKTFIEQQLAGQ